jgi:hypothetical protein
MAAAAATMQQKERGTLTTRVVVARTELALNADISAGGSIRVEALGREWLLQGLRDGVQMLLQPGPAWSCGGNRSSRQCQLDSQRSKALRPQLDVNTAMIHVFLNWTPTFLVV